LKRGGKKRVVVAHKKKGKRSQGEKDAKEGWGGEGEGM